MNAFLFLRGLFKSLMLLDIGNNSVFLARFCESLQSLFKRFIGLYYYSYHRYPLFKIFSKYRKILLFCQGFNRILSILCVFQLKISMATIKSKIKMQTQELTTTLMVARPTPLAPEPACKPW